MQARKSLHEEMAYCTIIIKPLSKNERLFCPDFTLVVILLHIVVDRVVESCCCEPLELSLGILFDFLGFYVSKIESLFVLQNK